MDTPKDRAEGGGATGYPQHVVEEQPILRTSFVDEDVEVCDPSRTIPTDSEGLESL